MNIKTQDLDHSSMIISVMKHMSLPIQSFSVKKLMCCFIALAMLSVVNDSEDWELIHHLNDSVTEDYLSLLDYIFSNKTYAYNHFLRQKQRVHFSHVLAYHHEIAEICIKMTKFDSMNSFAFKNLSLKVKAMIVQHVIILSNCIITVQYVSANNNLLWETMKDKCCVSESMSSIEKDTDWSIVHHHFTRHVILTYLIFHALCLTNSQIRSLAVQEFFSHNCLMTWNPHASLQFLQQLLPLSCIHIQALMLFIGNLDNVSIELMQKLITLCFHILCLVLSENVLLELRQACNHADFRPQSAHSDKNTYHLAQCLHSLKSLEAFHIQHSKCTMKSSLHDVFVDIMICTTLPQCSDADCVFWKDCQAFFIAVIKAEVC